MLIVVTMKTPVLLIFFLLFVLVTPTSHATTGIDSVSYLWGAVLVLLALIVVLVLLVNFVKNIRKDTKKHHNKQDE